MRGILPETATHSAAERSFAVLQSGEYSISLRKIPFLPEGTKVALTKQFT